MTRRGGPATTITDDIEQFLRDHCKHGQLVGDATEPTLYHPSSMVDLAVTSPPAPATTSDNPLCVAYAQSRRWSTFASDSGAKPSWSSATPVSKCSR